MKNFRKELESKLQSMCWFNVSVYYRPREKNWELVSFGEGFMLPSWFDKEDMDNEEKIEKLASFLH